MGLMTKSYYNTGSTGKTPFSVIEAYKTIRLRLIDALQKNNGKIVAISSPNASEGKSTTIVNLSLTFAQLDKKILLIDCDTRRSTIHTKLKMENKLGLSDIITGAVSVEEATFSYKPNLDIITSGTPMNNPTELLNSPTFDKLLTDASQKYDYIFIDTPPINIVSDALIVGKKCDGMVVILRAESTTYETFKVTLANINDLEINLIGVVMNDMKSPSEKYYKYSKYKYKYYSRYGYYK